MKRAVKGRRVCLVLDMELWERLRREVEEGRAVSISDALRKALRMCMR